MILFSLPTEHYISSLYQFVILIYDSIERGRNTFLFYIRTEFTPDQRSFVQFSRRCTEYLSNGLDAHEAYVYFMTSSAAALAMKASIVLPRYNDTLLIITPLYIFWILKLYFCKQKIKNRGMRDFKENNNVYVVEIW